MWFCTGLTALVLVAFSGGSWHLSGSGINHTRKPIRTASGEPNTFNILSYY